MKPLPLCALLLLTLALPAADLPPASQIAARIIRERAHELELRGQGAVAGELRALADQLASGQVPLADAHLVVQIALAGTTISAPPSDPQQQRRASAAAETAAAILDGTPLGDVPPAGTTPATPAPVDERRLDVPIATTVKIADWMGEPRSLLVMIGAGKDQHVVEGQRLLVRRGDQQLAVLSITQVKDTSAIGIAIPGTFVADVQIKPGDAVVSQ